MKEIVFRVERGEEGGYVVRAPDGDVFSEADDIAVLRERLHEAVKARFAQAERPTMYRLHYEIGKA